MKYLLDTCIISFYLRAHKGVHDRVIIQKLSNLYISIFTKIEIEFRLQLRPSEFKHIRKVWQELSKIIKILPFDDTAAGHVINLRTLLHKQGKTIGHYDTLIAATALAHNLVCVTNNVSEFNRVPDLKIEDWSV